MNNHKDILHPISPVLEEARAYEQVHKGDADPYRPGFHFTPMTGWCNDPNGFSVYKGEYHLFFQYYPYATEWGLMHWGHAKTKDFITWEYLPAALAADRELDSKGCFSGSAIETADGKHILYYTGCYAREDHPEVEMFQQQCIAIGDGVNYVKLDSNPVIGPDKIPEGYSLIDFRDPKVWKDGEHYSMVVSNRLEGKSGDILLYESEDGLEWSFVSVLEGSQYECGRMWECPDLFHLDGQDILLASPQEMEGNEKDFFDGYANIAVIGSYDPKTHSYERSYIHTLDLGPDFYAPQTLCALDGRRIMIAWMQNWNAKHYKMTGDHFFGEMTIPRELSYKKGRVCQLPVKELDAYRGKKYAYDQVWVEDEMTLDGVEGSFADLNLKIHTRNNFRMHLRKSGESAFLIDYNYEKGSFRIDRSQLGMPDEVLKVRTFYIGEKTGDLTMRILLDRYSVEMFINDGEYAASFLLKNGGDGISFSSEGGMEMDVEFWELTSLHPIPGHKFPASPHPLYT